METIDAAFDRHVSLVLAHRRLAESFQRNPLNEEFVAARIAKQGSKKKEDVLRAGNAHLDRMRRRLDDLAILDMCSAFENEFAMRIATAIGEARRLVRGGDARPPFYGIKERLVREANSFEGLGSMFELAKGRVSAATFEGLGTVRKLRNTLAHGSAPDRPLPLTPEQVRDLLVEVARELW